MTPLASPELTAIQVTGTTRAAFLVRATLTAGALVGAHALSPFVTGALADDGDRGILEYALTLEHLEAAFYARAVAQVSGLSPDVRELAEQLARDEAAHVKALEKALRDAGGSPGDAPGVDFGGAFSSEAAFLRTANTFEDTGVSAYNGAGPRLTSKALLAAAGSIVQVEARHAALIRMARDKPPSPRTFDEASSKAAVLRKVAPFLTG